MEHIELHKHADFTNNFIYNDNIFSLKNIASILEYNDTIY